MFENLVSSTRARIIAGAALLVIVIVAIAVGCSGGGGGSSSSSACDVKISTGIGSVYMTVSNPGGSISASDCASLANQSSDPSDDATASQVGSLPGGLSSACNGTESGLSYTVYSDGSSEGSVLASAACTGITDDGS